MPQKKSLSILALAAAAGTVRGAAGLLRPWGSAGWRGAIPLPRTQRAGYLLQVGVW